MLTPFPLNPPTLHRPEDGGASLPAVGPRRHRVSRRLHCTRRRLHQRAAPLQHKVSQGSGAGLDACRTGRLGMRGKAEHRPSPACPAPHLPTFRPHSPACAPPACPVPHPQPCAPPACTMPHVPALCKSGCLPCASPTCSVSPSGCLPACVQGPRGERQPARLLLQALPHELEAHARDGGGALRHRQGHAHV